MKRANASLSISLNTTADGAPEWIEVLPPGPRIEGRDGRHWVLPSPAKLIAASLEDGAPLFVDYEHASELRAPKGEDAPAAGWITALEERNGSVWARVEWTERAAAMIKAREYRYISPTFYFNPNTLEVRSLISAGLTNKPNLSMTALNHADASVEGTAETETSTMNKEELKALCKKLGLKEEASADAILSAVDGLISDKQTALNAAQSPSLDKFVPRADFDKVKSERDTALNTIKEGEKTSREAEIVAAVDDAVKAGKIAPASKDFYLGVCRKDGGLAEFKTFIEKAPSITASNTNLDGKQPAANAGELTADEKAVCKAMGLTEDDFKKARA